jgi:DNA-3-methyladenine glycosylase II
MDFEQKLQAGEVYLSGKDPVLSLLIKAYGPCRLRPHSDHYGELVGSIVGQQLSVSAAATIWLRVLDLFGGKMPTPAQLIEVSDDQLRACGLSWSKVSYVKDLARHVLDKRLDLDHVATMPNEQLIEQLTTVKGIGQWSAHMFMIFGLGRLDILPTGDLGIRKALMLHYKLPELPDPAMCVTMANENGWNPYESVACWYLWKSLDGNKPGKQTRHDA